MKIDVFDSFAVSGTGNLMHFDVFVKTGSKPEVALKYGQDWLKSLGENPETLKQTSCNFCHSETANPEVTQQILQNGYFILQMEGCPTPFFSHS